MPALIFLVIATAGENLFGFLSQLAYNSGILSKFARHSETGQQGVAGLCQWACKGHRPAVG